MKPRDHIRTAEILEQYASDLRRSHTLNGDWVLIDGLDEAAKNEHDELQKLAALHRREAVLPDPLGEALNSGDGVYRP